MRTVAGCSGFCQIIAGHINSSEALIGISGVGVISDVHVNLKGLSSTMFANVDEEQELPETHDVEGAEEEAAGAGAEGDVAADPLAKKAKWWIVWMGPKKRSPHR